MPYKALRSLPYIILIPSLKGQKYSFNIWEIKDQPTNKHETPRPKLLMCY